MENITWYQKVVASEKYSKRRVCLNYVCHKPSLVLNFSSIGSQKGRGWVQICKRPLHQKAEQDLVHPNWRWWGAVEVMWFSLPACKYLIDPFSFAGELVHQCTAVNVTYFTQTMNDNAYILYSSIFHIVTFTSHYQTNFTCQRSYIPQLSVSLNIFHLQRRNIGNLEREQLGSNEQLRTLERLHMVQRTVLNSLAENAWVFLHSDEG